MIIKYPCIIKEDSGIDNNVRYLVTFPDLEESLTEGATIEEALFNAEEALNLTLESRFYEKIEIPYPSTGNYRYFITPSVQIQSALLVKFSRGKKTLSDLARVLNTSWAAASKLEDLHHFANLKQLDRTAQALGKKLVISME